MIIIPDDSISSLGCYRPHTLSSSTRPQAVVLLLLLDRVVVTEHTCSC
jgi:hypothetical protein